MNLRHLLFSVGIALLLYEPSFSQTNLIGPPLGLEWGMPYSEITTKLKERKIDLDKPKEEKAYKLPSGFKVAKVGKYEVLNRKTDPNLACFNTEGELCAFQINLRWIGDDGEAKGMQFWKNELEKAIVSKYSGEGFKKHNDPDQNGAIPEVAFRDEVGNEVAVYFQNSKDLFGTKLFYISVFYSNEEILRETRKQQKETKDI